MQLTLDTGARVTDYAIAASARREIDDYAEEDA